ncbi:hypothetical protein Tco_1030992 [Tanacetum coccineum]|uniref:Uncharacterized protein n=1 Tax=Tanacetum coccineum TaxID=301880 RepID=A0ABQ5G829_9ASTR
MAHEGRKPHPCGSLLDILTGLTNATCDEQPRAVSSILGRHSSKATHACCFVPRPHTYSTLTCIVSHANEPWQVAVAIAAVRSAMDEKVVLVGLSRVSSPLHAMKSQSQIQSSAAVKFGGVTDWVYSRNVPITFQQWRELSQEINNYSVPTLISQAPGPSQKRSRSPSSPSYPDATTFSNGKPASETPELNPEDVTTRLEDVEVEIDTLHADTKDKELLISELQDSLAAAENEIALLQIRVTDAEDRHAEDHDQIQIILAHLGL